MLSGNLNLRKGIPLLVWLALSAYPALAQEKSDESSSRTFEMAKEPTNCEFHIATLDAAHHRAGNGGLIIFIARLGDGESRTELNRRRLHNARTHLTDYSWQRDPKTIVIAEGERVSGYGRIEIYVGDKLFYTLMIARNRDFLVGACSYEGEDPCAKGRERNLYPCLDRNVRRGNANRAR